MLPTVILCIRCDLEGVYSKHFLSFNFLYTYDTEEGKNDKNNSNDNSSKSNNRSTIQNGRKNKKIK